MPTTVLDHQLFPHIFDLVFEFSPRAALIAFRVVSRELKERADTILCKHIYILDVPEYPRSSYRTMPGKMFSILNSVNGFVTGIYDGSSGFPTYDENGDIALKRVPGLQWKDRSAEERAECLRLLTAHTRIVDYSSDDELVSLDDSPVHAALAKGNVHTVRGASMRAGSHQIPAPTLICFSQKTISH